MSSWREERRADRAADAEIVREDRMAAAQAQAVLIAARSDADRTAATARDEQARKARQAKTARRQARRDRRHRAVGRVRRWAAASVVDLLIYPLAGVSAAMAIPAMAAYGVSLYGAATGWLLAALSELGMWAFAAAVQVSRRRTPDRPVWALQTGIVVFAAEAMALNFVHGLGLAQVGGVPTGIVMAIVSVAGVAAHQLVVTGARRSRAEREAARLARQQRRRANDVARLAARSAVAEVTAEGAVTLVYPAGRFVPVRRWGRVVLRPADTLEPAVPDRLPGGALDGGRVVPGTTEDDPDSLTAEITEWLDGPEGTALAAEVAPESRNRPGTAPTPSPDGGTTPDRAGSGTTGDLGSLLARIRAEIAAGTMPANPSRRAIQRALKVRASKALEIKRALDNDPGNPGAAGQPARV